MADRIFDTGNANHAPSAQDFDGSWHTFGSRAAVSEACDLVGWAVYCPNPEPANYRWLVYKVSDESIVAEVDLAALTLTPGAWNSGTSADFDDPGDVALDDEDEYFVVYATDGDFNFRDSSLAFPYGTGIVTASEAAFFNGGAGPTVPDSFSTAFVFPADMIVEAAGGGTTHDAEGTAAGTGASSATAAVTREAAGTAAATGASSATATVTREGAGTAAAAGASSATSTVDREASGTAAATGAGTASATVDRAATGAVAAAGSSTAAATVTREAAGTAAATGTATATATIDPGGVPAAPAIWRAGPPEVKWHAGPPELKWHIGPPEGS